MASTNVNYKELYDKLKEENEKFSQNEESYDRKIFSLENQVQELNAWINQAQYEKMIKSNDTQILQQHLNDSYNQNQYLQSVIQNFQQGNFQNQPTNVDMEKFEQLKEQTARKSFEIMELQEQIQILTVREEAIIKENKYLQLVTQADKSKDDEIERLKDFTMFLGQQIEKLQKNLQEKVGKIEFLENQVDEIQQQFEVAEEEFFEMDQAMEEMVKSKEENEKIMKHFYEKNTKLTKDLKKSENKITKVTKKKDDELAKLQEELDDMTDDYFNLKLQTNKQIRKFNEEKEMEIQKVEEHKTEEMKMRDMKIKQLEEELMKCKEELEEMREEWTKDQIENIAEIRELELILRETKRSKEEIVGQLREEVLRLKESKYFDRSRMVKAENKFKEISGLMHSREADEANIRYGLLDLRKELEKRRGRVQSTRGCFFWRRRKEYTTDLDILDEIFEYVERAFRSFA